MKQEERAAQVWPVLVLAARNRQTLTYDLLGKLIGVPAQGLAHTLGHIMYWCQERDYPPLTVLVVNQRGRPGDGLSTTGDPDADREAVYRADWLELKPTVEEFAAAYRRGQDGQTD